MPLALSLERLVMVAPVVFLIGVGLGLAASSRWLIVRRADWDKRKEEE